MLRSVGVLLALLVCVDVSATWNPYWFLEVFERDSRTIARVARTDMRILPPKIEVMGNDFYRWMSMERKDGLFIIDSNTTQIRKGGGIKLTLDFKAPINGNLYFKKMEDLSDFYGSELEFYKKFGFIRMDVEEGDNLVEIMMPHLEKKGFPNFAKAMERGLTDSRIGSKISVVRDFTPENEGIQVLDASKSPPFPIILGEAAHPDYKKMRGVRWSGNDVVVYGTTRMEFEVADGISREEFQIFVNEIIELAKRNSNLIQ